MAPGNWHGNGSNNKEGRIIATSRNLKGLLPENPEQTCAGLLEEVEGVPAAAFVSQPALLASEILGEEPSGPAMVHPSETAVPGPLWSELKDIGVKRALVVGVGLQVLQQVPKKKQNVVV